MDFGIKQKIFYDNKWEVFGKMLNYRVFSFWIYMCFRNFDL